MDAAATSRWPAAVPTATLRPHGQPLPPAPSSAAQPHAPISGLSLPPAPRWRRRQSHAAPSPSLPPPAAFSAAPPPTAPARPARLHYRPGTRASPPRAGQCHAGERGARPGAGGSAARRDHPGCGACRGPTPSRGPVLLPAAASAPAPGASHADAAADVPPIAVPAPSPAWELAGAAAGAVARARERCVGVSGAGRGGHRAARGGFAAEQRSGAPPGIARREAGRPRQGRRPREGALTGPEGCTADIGPRWSRHGSKTCTIPEGKCIIRLTHTLAYLGGVDESPGIVDVGRFSKYPWVILISRTEINPYQT